MSRQLTLSSLISVVALAGLCLAAAAIPAANDSAPVAIGSATSTQQAEADPGLRG